jgi:hypothetical protein
MLKNRIIVILFGLSILAMAVSAVIGEIGLPQTDVGTFILRFNPSTDRAEFLGENSTFFGIFGVVSSVIVTNFLLASMIYNRERFLSYMLAAGTLIISVIFIMASYIISVAN